MFLTNHLVILIHFVNILLTGSTIYSLSRMRRQNVRNRISDREICISSEGEKGLCVLSTVCKQRMNNYGKNTPTICDWNGFVCCRNYKPTRKMEVPGCGIRFNSGRTAPTAFLESDKEVPLIVGGTETTIQEWPWMAGLYIIQWPNIQDKWPSVFFCGAAIINNRYLLSAAHCFINEKNENRNYTIADSAVHIGNSNQRGGNLYEMEKIITHPQYKGTQFHHDIAVIKLKDELYFGPNIRPICLPERLDIRIQNLKGAFVTIAGWGDTAYVEEGEGGSPILRKVVVPVVDQRTCEKAYAPQRKLYNTLPLGITEQLICAGAPDEGKGSCSGDSGGPLMYLENGVYYLFGIVAFGVDCGERGHPGVYTRVTSYLKWIEEVAF